MDRTDDGRPLKLMVVLDEWSRECLAIRVARRLKASDVLEVFADLMEVHGVPAYIRSDNGPEMVAWKLRRWLARLGAGTLYIAPGSPWENGYCESFGVGILKPTASPKAARVGAGVELNQARASHHTSSNAGFGAA